MALTLKTTPRCDQSGLGRVDRTSGPDLPARLLRDGQSGQVSFRFRWYNNPLVVEDGGRPLSPDSLVRARPPRSTARRCPTGPGCCARRPTPGRGRPASRDAVQERTATLATWGRLAGRRDRHQQHRREVRTRSWPRSRCSPWTRWTALATSQEWYALRALQVRASQSTSGRRRASRRGRGRGARRCAPRLEPSVAAREERPVPQQVDARMLRGRSHGARS